MTRTSITRPLAAIAVASLLLSALSGCFLLPRNPLLPGSGGAGSVDAAVGDCWQTTYADMAAWATWEGGGPVDCSADHQSYTFFVGALSTPISDPWDGDQMSDELVTAIVDRCQRVLEDDFGWSEKLALVGLFFFVPSKADWDGGAHRVRCDLGLTDIGSDYAAPELADLPADVKKLVAHMGSDPRAFELCLAGDAYTPYDSSDLSYADCTDYYDWRYGGTVDYPADPDAAYPGDDEASQVASDACAELGPEGDEKVIPYVPGQDDWQAGDRTIECWFSLVPTKPNVV